MKSGSESSNVTRRSRTFLITTFVATAAVTGAGILLLGWAGYRLNLTPSEPIGLWRILAMDRPVRIGDMVFICTPDSQGMREARRRGYLRFGLCAGGTAPLIKSVAALPGQVIAVGDEVRIDGSLLADSRLLPVDGAQRPLRPYSGGQLAAGEVYLHSDFPGSFDSRYFGPLPIGNILGLAQEVLTYAP